MCVPQPTRGGQRTTFRSWFSPSTLQVSGIEPKYAWKQVPLPPSVSPRAPTSIFHFFGTCSTRSLRYWIFIIYSELSLKKNSLIKSHIKKHGRSTFKHLWDKKEVGCKETVASLAFGSSGIGWSQVSTAVPWRPGQPVSETQQWVEASWWKGWKM